MGLGISDCYCCCICNCGSYRTVLVACFLVAGRGDCCWPVGVTGWFSGRFSFLNAGLGDCTCLILLRVWHKFCLVHFVIDAFYSILSFACFDRNVGTVLFGAAVGRITATFCVCCFGSTLVFGNVTVA